MINLLYIKNDKSSKYRKDRKNYENEIIANISIISKDNILCWNQKTNKWMPAKN